MSRKEEKRQIKSGKEIHVQMCQTFFFYLVLGFCKAMSATVSGNYISI